MYYNKKYKILFVFSPLMQCMLGAFNGWQLVLEVFNHSEYVKSIEGLEVNFTYSQSDWNRLVNYLKKRGD